MSFETEKKFIEVESNENVSAVHHKSSSDKWIFLCHGFGGNKDRTNKQRAQFFSQKGWNTVRFDFRGNCESSGNFIDQTLTSRIKDLKAVRDHFNPDNFVYFGTSFGGKVVFHSALEDKPDCVIVKAPVTYNKIMSKFISVIEEKGSFEYVDGKPIDMRFAEDLNQHSFSEVEENLDIPVFISHGFEDKTVRFENSVQALNNIESDIQLQKLRNAVHSYTDIEEKKMQYAVLDWLERLNL